MSFDPAELFSTAVRHVAPLAFEKKLACSFDCRGPQVRVTHDAAALQRSLHRLLCATIEVVDIGFLVFYAQMRVPRPGKCLLTVKAAGTGLLAGDERIGALLERLELTEDLPTHGARPRLHRARGVCPATGAAIEFASLPSEGALFNIEWLMPLASTPIIDQSNAEQARAWVIHDDEVAAESLVRRLQRKGWATTRFDSPTPAARRLRALPEGGARPALVLAIECAGVSAASVQCLQPLLPASTQTVYAALEGSPVLCSEANVPGFQLRVHPFSPADLRMMVQHLQPDRAAASGDMQPAALRLEDRPLLLVVDDNEVARIATTSIAESLGYEVRTAVDGLDAIEQCRRLQPVVVLMDVYLPRLDGVSAALRLRELERAGVLPPCRIIAVTAEANDDVRRACISNGLDAHLAKPLSRSALRAELRRLCAWSPAMASSLD
jgi:CheY-like chemotaxis protein